MLLFSRIMVISGFLRSLFAVLNGVCGMSMRLMGVVVSLFVFAVVVQSRGVLMMFSRAAMMFSRGLMVLSCGMFISHCQISC
jgi:hypothetical protein